MGSWVVPCPPGEVSLEVPFHQFRLIAGEPVYRYEMTGFIRVRTIPCRDAATTVTRRNY